MEILQYTDEGLLFDIKIGFTKVRFPLDKLNKKLLHNENWDTLNLLDQIWYQGLLQPKDGKYLLTTEDFYLLDEETVQLLPITKHSAQIVLQEVGNLGSKDYHISWCLLIHGKKTGRCRRKGVIATCGDYELLLSKGQYDLIREIELTGTPTTQEDRARFQAKCKFLAKKAGAELENFTEQRDFLFADRVDLDVQAQSPTELCLRPILPDLPEEIGQELPDHLKKTTQLRKNGKNVVVFTTDQTVADYNELRQHSQITGTDVPRFLENPTCFLPENLEIDLDLFADRVRGLKIHSAKVAPYIKATPSEGENGWFDIDTGLVLHDQTGTDPDIPVDEHNELEELLKEAQKKGEDYIFYQDRWIKVEPDTMDAYYDSKQKLHQRINGNKASVIDLRYILDIYENIESIEYNEEIIHFKNRNVTGAYTTKSFNGSLKDYQQTGFTFLKTHYDSKTGVLLADDMGLGKTVQVIALLAYMYDENQLCPSLLVMPNALIDNWEAELQKFLPSVRKLYRHQGTVRYREADVIKNHDVVLTTYETLSRDQTMLATIKWSCVICDEAQKIKNFHTLNSNAIKGMNTKYRIALTGTPVENRLSELWSIADFAQPGLLGSYKRFYDVYEKPIKTSVGPSREQLTSSLVDELKPIFLRRVKEEVLKELPVKNEFLDKIALSKQQINTYQNLVKEYQEGKANNKNLALATIQKMIMLCSHPRLLASDNTKATAKDLIQESPKLSWTVDKLKEIQKKREKVVIFTGYKKMQAYLRQVIFEQFGIDAKIINGEVKDNRVELIKMFSNTKGFNVLILSPKAAGVGLNIVAANHVIHYTREWNPAVENQATDRVYRIGQEKDVTVYYPVMDTPYFTTAEIRLDQVLNEKKELMHSVIIPADLEVTWKDLMAVLQ